MPQFQKKERDTTKSLSFYFDDSEQKVFEDLAHQFFTNRGYSLKEGDKANGIYEKGNRTLRILLGAFYKYFKFKVYTEFNGNGGAKLTVLKATSGMSGGAIGVGQVRTEMNRLENELPKI